MKPEDKKALESALRLAVMYAKKSTFQFKSADKISVYSDALIFLDDALDIVKINENECHDEFKIAAREVGDVMDVDLADVKRHELALKSILHSNSSTLMLH